MTTDLPTPLHYDEHAERVPADEAEDIRQVIDAVQRILKHSHTQTGKFQGDVHVKSDGCASGEFQVLPNLPDELAQGLFQHPRTYRATVRFSNAAGQENPDWMPDGRGLAIQVQGVNGDRLSNGNRPSNLSAQDFVMVNHPVFVARNVKDYLRLENVLADTADRPLATVQEALTGGSWNPLSWHWKEALTAVQITARIPAHPASHTYCSMAPIRYGKHIAKYRVKPVGDPHSSLLQVVARLGSEADALRLMLEETLRSEPILFEFQVQLRTSVESMPVEDPTVEWPESESPYRTVAILLLPRQEIGTALQREACEQLSFDVWNGLVDHQPLGGINRLRKEVYPISAAWRLQKPSNSRVEANPEA